MNAPADRDRSIAKAPTGIPGLDEITHGGLPRGRPTLACGGPGCGKTLLGMEFLVRGATMFDEPGVFVSFEETADDLAENVRSLGFDLPGLIDQQKLRVDHVHIQRDEIEESGDYDLEGLFIRLGHAIDGIGAKRIVLDTVEALFANLSNAAILRSELLRLFRWLKDKGVTALVTAERGEGRLTRSGLEEYVSDCVILLDNRVYDQLSTRRLRIVKYRGTAHGSDEYPFLIDEMGIFVLPITSLGLEHEASEERVSTGVAGLDAMLGGAGVYRGSSVLVSGSSGAGKTSLAAHFAHAACSRGERCLYLALEESPGQIVRNLRSIGLDLEPWIAAGKLRINATRATSEGFEMHLSAMLRAIREFRPDSVVVDPVTTFAGSGTRVQAESMLVRMVDFLKSKTITAFLTSLADVGESPEQTATGLSSIIDTWVVVRTVEVDSERRRWLYVLKSRGMAHSNRIHEVVLANDGIRLSEVRREAGGRGA